MYIQKISVCKKMGFGEWGGGRVGQSLANLSTKNTFFHPFPYLALWRRRRGGVLYPIRYQRLQQDVKGVTNNQSINYNKTSYSLQ